MYTPIKYRPSKKYGNNVWEVYSPKLKRKVNLYSDLEYENWILIETDFHIETYCEQPKKICVEYQGIQITSIFDMWVKWKDGKQTFMEVKYTKDLDPGLKRACRSIKQTGAQRVWCEKNGFDYLIRTEKEIRCNPVLLQNKKKIVNYVTLFQNIQSNNTEKILHNTLEEGVTIANLSNLLEIRLQELIPELYKLIYLGLLDADLNTTPLCSDSLIWKLSKP